MNLYLQLFISFLQIGALSFGGGYAAMPLIQQQVVTLHGWLSLSEIYGPDYHFPDDPRPHRHQFRHLRGNQGRRVLGGPLCYRLRPAFLPAGFPAGLGLFKIRSPLHNPGRTLSCARAVIAMIASAGFSILISILRPQGLSSLAALAQNVNLRGFLIFLGARLFPSVCA